MLAKELQSLGLDVIPINHRDSDELDREEEQYTLAEEEMAHFAPETVAEIPEDEDGKTITPKVEDVEELEKLQEGGGVPGFLA